MKVLKVLFIILLIFTVIWFASGKTTFSTVDTTMTFVEFLSNKDTLIERFTDTFNELSLGYNNIFNSIGLSITTKIYNALRSLFDTITLPVDLLVDLCTWLVDIISTVVSFVFGGYIA